MKEEMVEEEMKEKVEALTERLEKMK